MSLQDLPTPSVERVARGAMLGAQLALADAGKAFKDANEKLNKALDALDELRGRRGEDAATYPQLDPPPKGRERAFSSALAAVHAVITSAAHKLRRWSQRAIVKGLNAAGYLTPSGKPWSVSWFWRKFKEATR